MDVTHIVATRLNLGRSKEPAWTRKRIAALRRFCLPGIKAQTFKDFRWVLLVDPNTPAEILEELSDLPIHAYAYGSDFRGDLIRGDWWVPFSEWCREHVETEWVATTRLDSDDVFHPEYMAEVAENVRPEVGVLVFRGGLIVQLPAEITNGQAAVAFWPFPVWYQERKPGNNFHTRVERTAEADTAYCWPHQELMEHLPYRIIESFPRWLVVRHAHNYYFNRRRHKLKGRRFVAGADQVKEFAFLKI
jgi:hypothetical protein